MSKGLSRWCALLSLVAAPAVLATTVAAAQSTSTSVCKDGTTSAASGRGACSGHGGVDRAATKAARAPRKTKATVAQVACNDGTTSKPGRGACSHHGGVVGASPSPTTASTPPRSVPNARAAPSPTLPAQVPEQSPARTRSQAKSRAPSAAGSGAREDNNPVDAIAQCRDGLYSHAKHRRGACSRHGGVAKWMAA